MLGTEITTVQKKIVCRFCKTQNYEDLYNPIDKEVQKYCNYCDAWTTLVYAAPAYIKAAPQKRYFYSKPPVFKGATQVEIVRRSTLPDSVKVWALYRLSRITDDDHSDIKALVAAAVKSALDETIINRAAKSIARCTTLENLNIDVCIYRIILFVIAANRVGFDAEISIISRKIGISEQTLYAKRKWSKVTSKSNALVQKDYKPPLLRLIDAIQQITKGFELSWQLGVEQKRVNDAG